MCSVKPEPHGAISGRIDAQMVGRVHHSAACPAGSITKSRRRALLLGVEKNASRARPPIRLQSAVTWHFGFSVLPPDGPALCASRRNLFGATFFFYSAELARSSKEHVFVHASCPPKMNKATFNEALNSSNRLLGSVLSGQHSIFYVKL